jgi:hypothetical protein
MDVVIARYNEDLAWAAGLASAADVRRVVVYNKGGDLDPPAGAEVVRLPNVGREAHTFLFHIAARYRDPDPPAALVLLQGDPFPHGVAHADLRDPGPPPPGGLRGFGSPPVLVADGHGMPHHHLPVARTFELLFPGEPVPDRFAFVPGAQHVVAWDRVAARPLAFWERAYRAAAADPEFPWTFERLWAPAFSAQLP